MFPVQNQVKLLGISEHRWIQLFIYFTIILITALIAEEVLTKKSEDISAQLSVKRNTFQHGCIS